MKKQSKIDEYCIYCGEDLEKGHSERCPITHGVKISPEGYIAWGYKADPHDRELNLHIARMGILLTLRKDGVGPRDRLVAGRLAYEHIKFPLERINMELIALIEDMRKSNPIKRFFIKRKINKLEKDKYALYDLGKTYSKLYGESLPMERIDELFSSYSEFNIHRKISFENTKNIKVDMKLVEKYAREHPNGLLHQDVKNPEEFKWRHWALNASMNGEYERAIEYADKGIKINPKSAYLFYVRGRSKGDIGQFKEGIMDLTEAIKLKPTLAESFVERGDIKQKIGDLKGAKEDFKKAKAIDPSVVLPK